MKPRKTKDLQRVLQAKGFVLYPEKAHHQFYHLVVAGKKTAVKKQLRFAQTRQAEDFFDCPLSGDGYVALLRTAGELA